jgi:hypothetical protein
MKIILAFVGRYSSKECVIYDKDFIELIDFYKKQFINYDVEFKLYTWDKNINVNNYIEVHKFNEPSSELIMKNVTNFNNQSKDKWKTTYKDIDTAASFINIYRMFIIRKYAMEHIYKNYKDSYVFLLRPDAYLNFGDLKQWIKTDCYVTHLKRAWRNKYHPEHLKHDLYNKKHVPITDQISIGECKILYNFYNMNDTTINELFMISHNVEQSIFNRLKQLNIINYNVDIDCKDNYLISQYQ